MLTISIPQTYGIQLHDSQGTNQVVALQVLQSCNPLNSLGHLQPAST